MKIIEPRKIQLEDDFEIDFKDVLLQEIDFRVDERESYPNLKKWLRYQLFQTKDAEIVLKKSTLINKLGWYNTDIALKERYLDCIFSMKTYLNMFLRYYNKQAANHTWLLVYFDDIINEQEIENFTQHKALSGKSKKNLYLCFMEIEKFSKNTNTLGNYMYTPDSTYNSKKGLKIWNYNDRIDFFLKDIYSQQNHEYKVWFDDTLESLYLSSLFSDIKEKEQVRELSNFKLQKKLTFIEEDIEPFYEYLKFINIWIENRTTSLIKMLN